MRRLLLSSISTARPVCPTKLLSCVTRFTNTSGTGLWHIGNVCGNCFV